MTRKKNQSLDDHRLSLSGKNMNVTFPSSFCFLKLSTYNEFITFKTIGRVDLFNFRRKGFKRPGWVDYTCQAWARSAPRERPVPRAAGRPRCPCGLAGWWAAWRDGQEDGTQEGKQCTTAATREG